MPLAPKISVTSVDTKTGTTVTVQDTTGTYNVSTNPGGYGTPNYDTTDLDWALLWFRNYNETTYHTLKLTSLTSILGSGQSVAGFVNGIFGDGVWEVKYYPIVAHPVTPNVDTTITWTVGSKTFNLTSANTRLAGVAAILIKDISQEKLYFLDPNSPPTSSTATVTEQLPSTGTGLVALAYEADTRFMMTKAADDCLATFTGLAISDCLCDNELLVEAILRRGKRDGATTHFNTGNYQAAHNIITQLAAYCDNTVNCNCR